MDNRAVSTGVDYLDALLGGLKAGDNIVWQTDSGAPVEFFMRHFLRNAVQTGHNVVFVSFSHSPQSVINRYLTGQLRPHFHLVDAFTSGFGKDNSFFADFYRSREVESLAITRVGQPNDPEQVSSVIDRLSETAGEGAWYVFDSPTAMLDAWGGEEAFLRFFGYLCPKLYDLGTLAYWIIEKQAHSPACLARLMHVTQVVVELGASEDGIGLTVRKAEDRSAGPVGVTHHFPSVEGPETDHAQRDVLEMRLLSDISAALGSSLDLSVVFDGILQVLARGLDMRRGTLVLEEGASGIFRIAAAHGLTEAEMARGVYRLGEGITGTVIQNGEAVVVPDIRHDPRFLDRTGARGNFRTGPPVSFVCVPLSIGQEVIGALSIDREFVDGETLARDERLLQIVASMVAQAIKIHRMVGVDKEELLQTEEHSAATESRYAIGSIVAASPRMREALSLTRVVAESNATVLIHGETGTGKELIAHIIHSSSPRREKPFVAVNCGALPETLLEPELFGHVRGSFTGAVRDRTGRFALADGGTIFLDEVASMSNQLQVRLLRVLQEKEFEPVGSSEAVKVNVRVVGATNVDLAEKVQDGEFREDLYYRLNVVPIHLPPLRERREDIPRLTEHFMNVFSRQNDKQVNRMSREALDLLMSHDWPGNVRELENCMERAIVLCQTGTIGAELLPEAVRNAHRRPRPKPLANPHEALRPLIDHLRSTASGNVYEAAVALVEEAVIRAVLEANDGVQTRTAQELGVSRNTLRDRIRAYRL